MGPCAYCSSIPMPGPPVPPLQAQINVHINADIETLLRNELARLLRDFAELESGPVGERLRQIAGVFDGSI